MTLQFHAGLGAVRVEVSCTNPRAAVHPRGVWDLADPGSIFIRDLSVTMRPALLGAGGVAASIDRDDPMTRVGNRFEVYRTRAADTAGSRQITSTAMVGYQRRFGDSGRSRKAARCPDFEPLQSRLDTRDSRISIATPLFWEVFPKALTLGPETCAVGVLPRQFSDSHQSARRRADDFCVRACRWRRSGSDEPLAWARSPLIARVDPEAFRSAGEWAPLAVGSSGAQQNYENLVEGVIAGDGSAFARRREIVTSMAGAIREIYADHEAVGRAGLISHYNNQYHAIAGMATRFMKTGDARWWSAMRELAAHVMDIDRYHSTEDRSAYSGGYFWHTQHYAQAGTATHRSYSRSSVSSGGGPSAEHNYTTGLLWHQF